MEITLKKATVTDCEKIHEMQKASFRELLDKYGDMDTSPGAEPLETIILKMNQNFSAYYLIQYSGEIVGAIRIVELPENIFRISPMFILPEFQGKHFACQVLERAEELYPQAAEWRLETIKEEPKLCYLYEKMGYERTGQEEPLQENMTITYYAK